MAVVGLCREGNCHLHLGCTFLDGGVKAEKDWLGPLLAPFISDAAKQLRVSDDMNQLYRAQAKGCGEQEEGHLKTLLRDLCDKAQDGNKWYYSLKSKFFSSSTKEK